MRRWSGRRSVTPRRLGRQLAVGSIRDNSRSYSGSSSRYRTARRGRHRPCDVPVRRVPHEPEPYDRRLKQVDELESEPRDRDEDDEQQRAHAQRDRANRGHRRLEDLGSSSDRAMMTGRSSEGAACPRRSAISPAIVQRQSERGSRELGRTESASSDSEQPAAAASVNRELDREQCEQDQLPERGRSQSER